MNRSHLLFLVFGAALAVTSSSSAFAASSAAVNFSGVVDYMFAANPQEITPKLHNWEVRLSKADSRKGSYEIVQITTAQKPAPGAPETSVIVDSKVIAPDLDGIIDFKLHVGDKEPKRDMGRHGDGGEPLIFSGIGTANAQSGWIVMPGEHVDQMSPAPKGTPLKKGKLDLIQISLHNDHGDKFRADILLRRK